MGPSPPLLSDYCISNSITPSTTAAHSLALSSSVSPFPPQHPKSPEERGRRGGIQSVQQVEAQYKIKAHKHIETQTQAQTHAPQSATQVTELHFTWQTLGFIGIVGLRRGMQPASPVCMPLRKPTTPVSPRACHVKWSSVICVAN